MKKLLILLLSSVICILSTDLRAQVAPSTPQLDTLTNTDTSRLVLPVANGYYRNYTTQIVATKLSGTLSANIILQVSLDGANWVNTDTLAVTDVATPQTKIVTKGPSAYYYYRWYGITSGTQSFTVKAYAWLKE